MLSVEWPILCRSGGSAGQQSRRAERRIGRDGRGLRSSRSATDAPERQGTGCRLRALTDSMLVTALSTPIIQFCGYLGQAI